MNGVGMWVALGFAEVALLAFVFLLIFWIRHRGAAKRDRAAVARLIEGVRRQKSQREEVIATFLEDKMGLSGDALVKARTALVREELRILQAFASIYAGRHSGSASQFQLELERAIAPYHELGGAVAVADGPSMDDSELEALRQENVRLSDELSVTMDTLSRMLTEYSGVFIVGEEQESPSDEAEPAVEIASVPDGDDVSDGEAAAFDAIPDAALSSPGPEVETGVEIARDPAPDPVDAAVVAINEEIGALDFEPEPQSMQNESGARMEDAAIEEDIEEDIEALGEVVELVTGEDGATAEEDDILELAAAPAEEDEDSSLVLAESLDENLGSLFDSDDISVLDELEQPSEASKTPDTIAI